MAAEGLTYAGYLSLDALLTIQRPVTRTDDAVTWGAERFFIVCHQASELWASQVLLDLGEAATLAKDRDWRRARIAVERAASVTALLSDHLLQLYHLPREVFLEFRVVLERASGAESVQFRSLLDIRSHPDVRALRTRLDAALAGIGAHRGCAHDECRAARGMEALVSAVARWRELHIQVVGHFIRDLPGTGGTSGVEHLLGRLAGDTRDKTPAVDPSRA